MELSIDEKIKKVGEDLKKKFASSPELRETFTSFSHFVDSELTRAELLSRFEYDRALRNEFGGSVDRLKAFLWAESRGLVKIIGHKAVE